jgi:hypothetical protein
MNSFDTALSVTIGKAQRDGQIHYLVDLEPNTLENPYYVDLFEITPHDLLGRCYEVKPDGSYCRVISTLLQ